VTAVDFTAIVDALQSHALTLGVFETVNGHEPANAPDLSGLTAAVWAQRLRPVPAFSGLNATAAIVEAWLRIYKGVQSLPADAIDPAMMSATDLLISAYSGDFDLGGLVTYVDLLGQHGVALEAQAGYAHYPDATYRVMTLTVPMVLDASWPQAA
jgi:hypothetical protein